MVTSAPALEKKPAVILRVHDETDADESGKFALPVTCQSRPNTTTYISKIPVFTEREIKAIYVPPGNNGIAFKLDMHGTLTLNTSSAQRVG
jgi:hypothetical protein